MSKADIRGVMAEFDANGDGAVSAEERQAARAEMRERMQARRGARSEG